MSKLKKNLIVAAVMMAAFAVALGSFLLFKPEAQDSGGLNVQPAAEAVPVRGDSHRLTTPKRSELTIVEFLDFECEGCGAAYPVVEKLREEYGDRVTFVARYFPMPGHKNGELAARTAEAAAQQGRFEEMYAKLFSTQKEWGEAQGSKESVFRGYAQQIGLDMRKFDAALADPKTAERVKADQRDGLALGVQGTPTFLVDGVKISTPQSYEAFKAFIDARLAG
ncbi:thioredoxin domain-containing protein [Streptomyces sp. NPDC006339]|uniref:DsbA family protein n=1 Tax=Streptomyces sp. NPDC006339 TaxID=3156755 RepID=UPI0033B6D985